MITWSLASGYLPSGLTLNPISGVISGTPTTLGVTTGTMRAGNQSTTAADQMLTITVAASGGTGTTTGSTTGSTGTTTGSLPPATDDSSGSGKTCGAGSLAASLLVALGLVGFRRRHG